MALLLALAGTSSGVQITCAPGDVSAAGVTATLALGQVVTCATGASVASGVSARVNTSLVTSTANAVASGVSSSLDTSVVASSGSVLASGVSASIQASVAVSTTPANTLASGVHATITTGSTSDVRLSWAQFDTKAAVSDVRFSWFAFDTKGVTSDVRLSWFAFNTKAKSEEKSGVNRLYWYQIQESMLKPEPKVMATEPHEVKVRYLKDLPQEPTRAVTPARPPYRVLSPLPISPTPHYGLTIFDIVKQQELTAEPYRATMNLPLAQRPQRVLVDDQAANDEALLLLLSA